MPGPHPVVGITAVFADWKGRGVDDAKILYDFVIQTGYTVFRCTSPWPALMSSLPFSTFSVILGDLLVDALVLRAGSVMFLTALSTSSVTSFISSIDKAGSRVPGISSWRFHACKAVGQVIAIHAGGALQRGESHVWLVTISPSGETKEPVPPPIWMMAL